jgi:phage shock protein E
MTRDRMNWIFLAVVVAVLVGLWRLKQSSLVSAEKARQLLGQGALVVDVRSPGEFASAHLARAINIPLSDLSEAAPRRFPDKNQVILLHCLSGGRSGIARQRLKNMGYPNVFNLGSYSRAEKIVDQEPK